MTDKYPHLREDMPHILQNCEDLGMASPYVACFVGSNGAVLVRRYTGWDRFEELAEHTEVAPGMYEDMALPITSWSSIVMAMACGPPLAPRRD
jgi:hypothetical protein